MLLAAACKLRQHPMQLPGKSRPFRFALVASCAAPLIAATPIVAQAVPPPPPNNTIVIATRAPVLIAVTITILVVK